MPNGSVFVFLACTDNVTVNSCAYKLITRYEATLTYAIPTCGYQTLVTDIKITGQGQRS